MPSRVKWQMNARTKCNDKTARIPINDLLSPVRLVGRYGEHSGAGFAGFPPSRALSRRRPRQHALEVVQRLRIYSENYVEPEPPEQNTQDAREMAARRDAGMQGGLLDRGSREH